MTSTPVKEVRPLYTWGDGVRSGRGILGLTQQQLADKAGTTQRLISEIENGRRSISDVLRVRIARALGVDPYVLFPYPDVEADRA